MANKYLDSNGLKHFYNKIENKLDNKQNKLTGEKGQYVGFDTNGNVQVADIKIGGRNLLLNSKKHVRNADYLMARYDLTETPIEGMEYTVQIKGTLGSDRERFRVFNTGGGAISSLRPVDGNRNSIFTQTFTWHPTGDVKDTYIGVYQAEKTGTSESEIEWIKLECGNKATDWTPAPEDMDARMIKAETSISAIPDEIKNAINDIQISGRNMLLNSSEERTIIQSEAGNNTTHYILSEFPLEPSSGLWVVSFDAKITVDAQVDGYFRGTSSTLSVPSFKPREGGNLIMPAGDEFNRYVLYCDTTNRDMSLATQLRIRIYSGSTEAALTVRNVKLEHGSVATGWTPAPEDKQDKLIGTAGQVVGFDDNGNAHAVNREIGGRNLLLNSLDPQCSLYSGATGVIAKNEAVSEWNTDGAIRVHGTGGTSTIVAILSNSLNSSNARVPKGDYIISCYVKNNSTEKQISVGRNNYVSVAPGEIKRVVAQQTGTTTPYLQIHFVTQSEGDAFDFTFWHPKLEIGNVATDWTPAPEDKQDRIDFIGGVNLLKDLIGAGPWEFNNMSMLSVSDPYGGKDALRMTAGTNTGNSYTPVAYLRYMENPFQGIAGPYTLSFWARSENTTATPVLICGDTSAAAAGLSKAWKQFVLRIEVSDPNAELRINLNPTWQNGMSMDIFHVKLERGTIATDWTPAPEDKQDKLIGTAGQVVGFDNNGNAVAQDNNNSSSFFTLGPGGVPYGKELTESWKSLSNRIKKGDFSGINIGDYKTITLSDEQNVVMEVAGIDQYYKNDDSHYIDFISQNCIKGEWGYNGYSGNNGTADIQNPWRSSTLYKDMNDTLYKRLPTDLQPYIIEKIASLPIRYSANETLTTDNELESSSSNIGKLWLPTEVEVFGTRYNESIYGSMGYGCNIQYPIFIGGLKHICKTKFTVGNYPAEWWLINASDNSSDDFCCVSKNGTSKVSSSHSMTIGIPLCFRIG